MTPRIKLQEFVFIGSLICVSVIGIVLLSSQKDLSSKDSQAASGNIFDVTVPANQPTNTPTPSVTKSAKAQDVPLKVLGRKEIGEQSYLYTELASKGLISNVAADNVTIHWLTEAPQQTKLYYGKKENLLIKQFSDSDYSYIHTAKLETLTPNTLYYYSGHAPITESFVSAPQLPVAPALLTLQGTISKQAGECLIRAIISNENKASSSMTAAFKGSEWKLDLKGIRSADYSAYYTPNSNDSVEFDVLCIDNNKSVSSAKKKVLYRQAVSQTTSIVLVNED